MQARYALALGLILAAGCHREATVPVSKEIEDRPALEAKLRQLLAERVESARQALAAVQAAFDAETVTVDLLVWANEAVCKAELAAAGTPDERIAAHVKRVQNFGKLLDYVEAKYNVGARGGEVEKFAEAKYCVESARIALIDECLASGREYPQFDMHPAAAGPAQP